MPSTRKPWTDRERLQALMLYCHLSFGQLHQHHLAVIDLAKRMERSPSSVAMKLTNYASLDPEIIALGKKGLSGASQKDRQLWKRFIEDPQLVALECEAAWRELDDPPQDNGITTEEDEDKNTTDYTGRNVMGMQQRRVGQSIFRKAVMIRYETRCVITGLRYEDLLIASHIVPWQMKPESRLDPANGLCLNALHDRAFDKGLLGIDSRDRIRICADLGHKDTNGQLKSQLIDLDGQSLKLTSSAFPNRDYLAWHYRECFRH